jgi:hypothetical protein
MEAVAQSVLREAIGIERLSGLADYPEIGWWMVDSVIATLKAIRSTFGGRIPRWEAVNLDIDVEADLDDPTAPAWKLLLQLFGKGVGRSTVEITDQEYRLNLVAFPKTPVHSWGSAFPVGYTTCP